MAPTESPTIDVAIDSALFELLIDPGMFRLDNERAEEVAKKLTIEQFQEYYDQLETIVGIPVATKIVREGEFLDYRNGTMKGYLELVREVSGKIRSKLSPEEEISESKAEVFYSVDSLKQYLNPQSRKEGINYSNFKLNGFRILYKNDEKAREYLANLIDKGVLTVSNAEHWNTGRDHKGARENNILIKIRHQVSLIFGELGIRDRFECEVNYNTRTMFIGDTTRQVLQEIREVAYKMQK